MNPSINFQTLLGADGQPAFVVVPYGEFMARFGQLGDLVPHAVVKLAFDGGMAPAKAWRTHLLLTQAEVAARMGVAQSVYVQLESNAKLRKAPREKIAAALRINAKQLDF